MDTPLIIKCCCCKAEKDCSLFSKRSNSKLGFKTKCKACVAEEYQTKKEQYKITKQKYYETNKEVIRVASAEKYKNDEDYRNKAKLRSKIRKQNNKKHIVKPPPFTPERAKEYNAEYYAKNKDVISEKTKQYAIKNKQKIKAYQREWNKTDKGITLRKATKANRRVKEKTAGKIDLEKIREIAKNASSCYWCKCKINTKISKSFHFDHYIPIAKGGTNDSSNFVISCASCNLKKNAKDPLKFANSIGRLL